MKTSFKLFNFLGAPVEISFWFFILLLMTSVSATVAIFLSVLIHEMAHAWVAHRRGWQVFGIKIDLFFGTAAVDMTMPERDSIPVVAAGPLSNLVFAFFIPVLMVFLESLGIYLNPTMTNFFETLFSVNIIFFIFNLLPIFPMDGGRLVKDFLVMKMKSNRLLARKIAATISLVASVGLLLYSISITAIFLIFFSCLFIYTAFKELQSLKD
jgi:Zn-dependent protease